MTTLNELYAAVDRLSPFSLQDGFDNSGLLVRAGESADRVLICLDITAEVVREAADKGCDAVVSHHPVIFHPLKSLDAAEPTGQLLKNGISAISAHTCLDMAEYGISDLMAEKLGFRTDGRILSPVHSIGGREYGYGRICRTDRPYTADELARHIKDSFGCAAVRYTDGGREINTVALCSGSGGEFLFAAARAADAYITGDIRHNVFIDAVNHRLTLFDAGHFHTENIAVEYLAERLSAMLPEAEIIPAESSTDPCRYCI